MRFIKKPVEIEAVQLRRIPLEGPEGEALDMFSEAPPGWLLDSLGTTLRPSIVNGYLVIEIDTLEGTMRAEPEDWIIRGVKGEIYPCKPDIFEITYERVEDVD